MKAYQIKLLKKFYEAYPAESIRVAKRLQSKSDKASVTSTRYWPGHRAHEINMIKLFKLKSYQTTNKWI